jgi:GAF domain-containing protein
LGYFRPARWQYRSAAVIVDDLEGDSDWKRACREARVKILALARSRSCMGDALIIEDRAIGFDCWMRLPNFYTSQHARLVMTIANQAAVAVQNALCTRQRNMPRC